MRLILPFLILIMFISCEILKSNESYLNNFRESSFKESTTKDIQKDIQKDPTLKIEPQREPEIKIESEIPQFEFIITYDFKILNDVPYGEKYRISTPINTLYFKEKYRLEKTCEISVKEKTFNTNHYPHYTDAQNLASHKKQMRYLLYNLLQEYKQDVLECLILYETKLDDTNTTINLESRTKTLVTIKSYILASFTSGVLVVEIFNAKIARSGL